MDLGTDLISLWNCSERMISILAKLFLSIIVWWWCTNNRSQLFKWVETWWLSSKHFHYYQTVQVIPHAIWMGVLLSLDETTSIRINMPEECCTEGSLPNRWWCGIKWKCSRQPNRAADFSVNLSPICMCFKEKVTSLKHCSCFFQRGWVL